jgi:hypothetical protein
VVGSTVQITSGRQVSACQMVGRKLLSAKEARWMMRFADDGAGGTHIGQRSTVAPSIVSRR